MGSTTRWHSLRKLEAPKRSTRLSDRGQSSERRNESGTCERLRLRSRGFGSVNSRPMAPPHARLLRQATLRGRCRRRTSRSSDGYDMQPVTSRVLPPPGAPQNPSLDK